ncbi:MAG: hypothetical protein O2866_05315 [archaeon]|nr:hypothetical protein [archaeon]
MESTNLLIAGIGGLGCSWAKQAFHRCGKGATLALVDADPSSFEQDDKTHILRLGHTLDKVGCAALPPLAEQRMRSLNEMTRRIFEDVELVVLLTALGGGVGTGASVEFARQARQSGAIVLAIAALPFDSQHTRLEIGKEGFHRLQATAHVAVQLSLERSRQRTKLANGLRMD